jgi:Insertion element 4 transposase N-terminal/Transposase DDE domain
VYLHAAIRDAVPATVPPGDPGRHPLDRLGLGAVPEFLPPLLVDEVIQECGCREIRRRALPARVTLYFVLALWFCPGAGYSEVLRVLFRQLRAQAGMSRWRIPTVSAAVQARRRLGRAPLKALFGRLCGTVPAAAHLPGMTAFGRELALLKVSADGTRLDVADTPANRRAFGDPPGGCIGPGRYPQIRLLALIACGTRALIDAAWSTVSTGEPLLLDKLVYRGNFRPGMLVLADRYFSGHPQVARIAGTGADLIIRVQRHRRLPVLRELPDGSYLSVLPHSDHPSKAERDRARGRRLPRRGLKARQALGMPVRVVEYAVTVIPETGQPRTERYRLITTLLDPDTAPAGQIARVYAERWESETGYADLKTYLRGRQQILRSKDPAGIAQELYALLIVYQLVQLARIRAAANRPGQEPCDPDRISFTVVLRALIRSIGRPSSQRLLHDVLDEIWGQPLLTRRPRSKPRERKGTAAFARACEQHPPSTVTYKLTMRSPDTLNTG